MKLPAVERRKPGAWSRSASLMVCKTLTSPLRDGVRPGASINGTARGEKVELVIQWDNNTRGRYTSKDHLVAKHFTGPDQGVLEGDAIDEVNPHVTTTWESLRSFFRVN
ncbi:hypothetical protein ABH915_003945 [Arthrobacter sp. MW3 TE3886]